MFMLVDDASDYIFWEVASSLVDLILWGWIWTLPQNRPFKVMSGYAVHLDQFLA